MSDNVPNTLAKQVKLNTTELFNGLGEEYQFITIDIIAHTHRPEDRYGKWYIDCDNEPIKLDKQLIER